ncbi:MAG: response regulator transcription factor [Anaerolineae bacterium]
MSESASILVVEDQPAMLENLRISLELSGYRVLTAQDGLEALQVLEAQPVDLILADVAMPRMNGYQLYERLSESPRWAAIPFIFVTARALDSDVRYGKELGVDDYLTKPIQLPDLLASVQGKLRRARRLAELAAEPGGATPTGPEALVVGKLRIEPGQHRASIDGQPVHLSPREFALLEYLAQRAGQVVPLTELCRVTHELDTDHAEAGSLLYPMIRTLRRKLGYPAGETGCIETVRGVGYRLVTPSED